MPSVSVRGFDLWRHLNSMICWPLIEKYDLKFISTTPHLDDGVTAKRYR